MHILVYKTDAPDDNICQNLLIVWKLSEFSRISTEFLEPIFFVIIVFFVWRV